jgi:putative FmdB family regulatory protein
MPIYEYTCRECGAEFEVLRSMKSADDPIICERCGSMETKRNLSLCFAHAGAEAGYSASAATSGGCAGCSGGSCSTCGR